MAQKERCDRCGRRAVLYYFDDEGYCARCVEALKLLGPEDGFGVRDEDQGDERGERP